MNTEKGKSRNEGDERRGKSRRNRTLRLQHVRGIREMPWRRKGKEMQAGRRRVRHPDAIEVEEEALGVVVGVVDDDDEDGGEDVAGLERPVQDIARVADDEVVDHEGEHGEAEDVVDPGHLVLLPAEVSEMGRGGAPPQGEGLSQQRP